MKRLYFVFFGTLLIAAASCRKSAPMLFEQVPFSHSGIKFNNLITENDSINPIDNAYVYNGGGVGVGDFNNDGLQDIYFTGNMVSNKLYINLGDFKFKDITEQAGVDGMARWGRGVSVIDINNDGLLDIYVCNSLLKDSVKRTNLLYINTGTDKDGIPHFEEKAKEYGLNINAHSTMASFFDYDNDGLLDMYLTVNEPNPSFYANSFRPVVSNGSSPSTGRLYKNTWDEHLKHSVFQDASKQANILIEGYGHAATISDINLDGWKDIYITNDFLSSNLLYINNGDGTFTDRSKEYFKHTSFNAMGNDIADMNNDGLADVFELDMAPEDNYRKKMMMMPNSDQSFQLLDHYGYQHQYVRNTLQLNQGPRVGQNDTIGNPSFSEIGFLSGLSQTDWSWTPLLADFDNDSYRDVLITNGYPKDVTDHDFIAFRENPYFTSSKQQLIEQLPKVKISNYGFRNNGDLTFTNQTKNWGLNLETFSNGAVYVDLDNDGKLDIVINNIDDKALVYRNTLGQREDKNSDYIQIKFIGDQNNRNGIGAWVDIYYDKGKHQVYENNPFRGYLSTMHNIAHFGLASVSQLDSVVIRWPNYKKQVINKVKTNQKLSVDIRNAHTAYSWHQNATNKSALFTEITSSAGINYKHQENDFIDFNIQKLLPHKLSEYSPAIAVGDVNGDGFEDMIIGGSSSYPAQLLIQQKDATFKQRNLLSTVYNNDDKVKDAGIVLFDANGDGKPDLYIASGGYENEAGSNCYQDRLYLNDGKGNFTIIKDALPLNFTSKQCVRAIDYNRDGKLDLFVSGRVEPWGYPKPVSSIILRNDSKKGQLKFTDVTDEVAPSLKNIGLVCDVLFSDYNNDGWPDLLLAGEWMPLTFLKNDKGKFVNETAKTGISGKTGWWNSIVAGDFRHTGRMDYIVGNMGLNSLYQVSEKYPAYITAGDFDSRGRLDAFPSIFLPDKDGNKKEYPAFVRDDAVKQLISLRKKFTNYKSYANATLKDLLSEEQFESALRLNANTQQSCYVRNEGNGKFTMIPLPVEAQVSVLNGMVVDDFDGDGNLDVIINGNDYGTEVSVGQYDALNGLMLKGDGKGGFKAISILKSGIYIPGNGKALVKLRGAKGGYLMAASQNRGDLKLWTLNVSNAVFCPNPTDVSAVIHYKDGSSTKQELYYGSSFLSQSGRFVSLIGNIAGISVTRYDGTSYVPEIKKL